MLDLLSGKIRGRKLKIGILGLGKSNLGILGYLNARGIDYDLTIRSDAIPNEMIPASRVFAGRDALCDIDEDILFLSPSVRRDRAELAAAARRGTLLSSDAELFFASTGTKVFAVTGSDGKSTTTYLISEFLNRARVAAAPAGNFGVSLCSLGDSVEAVACELSSFQLMYLSPTSLRAVVTNLTPNHLNWHKDFDEYSAAKANILKNARDIIIDYDSEMLLPLVGNYKLFAVTSSNLCYSELKQKIYSENYLTLENNAVFLNGAPYFSLDNAKRRESYNLRNYMLAAATTLGIAHKSDIENTLETFGGLPHRAELIANRGGISYINSSIDSSPERTLKTLRALSGHVSVIIGGAGKGLALNALAEELPKLTAGAVLMGAVGRELAEIFGTNGTSYKFTFAEEMMGAVKAAANLLDAGGTVILSPAATSFDRYRNFEERGLDFKNAVLALS